MDKEREVQGVRWVLLVVLAFLTTALTFELLSESHQAHLDRAWRARREKFETFRHAKELEWGRHLAAGDPTAKDNVVEWTDDSPM